MVSKYILGVDGGNTKTDYFLFDTLGNFIDFHRDVACSHEGLKDSFDGTYRLMSKAIKFILGNNDLEPSDIDWAVFGLAGVDTPYQKGRLEEIVEKIGFIKYKVVNDSFLGIKAIAPYGVCSVCGTGTSAGGIDKHDNYLQVGGIGSTVGDEAGGSWLARRAIRQVYDAMYRFGEPSMLDDFIMTTFGIADKYYLMEEISGHLTKGDINYTEIDKAVFAFANKGDEVCINILKEMANNLARSAAGAVVNLDFDDEPLIIMAGSVWVKGSNPTLIEEFKKKMNEYTKKNCNVVLLHVPPATGAIVWAMSLSNEKWPSEKVREMIIRKVEFQLKNIERNQ